MKKSFILGIFAAAAVAVGVGNAGTLDDVKSKGFIQCGVSTGAPGFAFPNDAGEWAGLDVDYCRALASAMTLRL